MTKLCRRLALLTCAVLGLAALAAPARAEQDKWCGKVHIRFFVGGAEGDAFGTIVYNGAKQAEHDLGAQVDYIFSGWNPEKMVQQLREAVAAHPDGISMMGHPGSAAILPLAAQAAKDGIRMMYVNVDLPDLRAKFGGGYIGAQLDPQGHALGDEAVRLLGLKKGDKAIVLSDWGMQARSLRELGTVHALEEAGLSVTKIESPPEWAADPNLALPVITAAVLNTPDLKAIVYPGGQMLGNVPTYMRAAGKKPGEIKAIGFDTSPQVVQAFDGGWVQLTSDQEPFLQGYMPILSLCQQVVYGLGPISLDTGAGFVNASNYKLVGELAKQGLR
jgi:simple sugar transport system substrate-binding protein